MQKPKKERIDIVLFNNGLTESREKGSRLVLAGQVFVDGINIIKPGTKINIDSTINIKKQFPYVGKGALKLESAYKEFGLNFKEKIIVDVGSSTGGFTDFCLQKGAKKVYSIDVGYGQLYQKLRNDNRVVVMEKTDIRDIKKLPDNIDFFVVDVSFISLEKILPSIKNIINSQNNRPGIICLVKPQFEVGKKIADKYKGIINNKDIQIEMVNKIINFANNLDFVLKGKIKSAIKGHKGNQEYLVYFN
ncbi:MAG: TlyA family RNA methyltransferase [Candidatus Woesearchaeota archaeon]